MNKIFLIVAAVSAMSLATAAEAHHRHHVVQVVQTVNEGNGRVLVTNGPVPDTRANRHLYGGPDSRAGRHTRARGN